MVRAIDDSAIEGAMVTASDCKLSYIVLLIQLINELIQIIYL